MNPETKKQLDFFISEKYKYKKMYFDKIAEIEKDGGALDKATRLYLDDCNYYINFYDREFSSLYKKTFKED